MDTPLQGLLALGADVPPSPHTATEPVGLPYKSPQDGEQPGEPSNIKLAQHRGEGVRGQPCSKSSA